MSIIDAVTRAEIMRELSGLPTPNLEAARRRLYRALILWMAAICAVAMAATMLTGWYAVLAVPLAGGLVMDLRLGQMIERELNERRAMRPMP